MAKVRDIRPPKHCVCPHALASRIIWLVLVSMSTIIIIIIIIVVVVIIFTFIINY